MGGPCVGTQREGDGPSPFLHTSATSAHLTRTPPSAPCSQGTSSKPIRTQRLYPNSPQMAPRLTDGSIIHADIPEALLYRVLDKCDVVVWSAEIMTLK